MHRAWPASRLVTVTGADRHGIHGAYGDTCVDGTVNATCGPGNRPARTSPARPGTPARRSEPPPGEVSPSS
ncbi:hypothetical protein [Streptomyces sp. NPDC005859]|uniref:hypothetical protein n=1 Tax=Streptomyces sp. NPDC005859 TaxID=3157170 RepID=UPI0034081F01